MGQPGRDRLTFLQSALLAGVVTVSGGASSPHQASFGRIEGTVRDNGQHTVPDVTVSVRRFGEGMLVRTTTDANGKFVLADLSLGSYDVDFALSGFDITRQHKVTLSTGTPSQELEARIDVSVECECLLSEEDPSAAILSAWIVDGANRPVPHAAVHLRAGAKTLESGYSGRDGEVEVRMRSDAHLTLVVSDEAFQMAAIDLRLPLQPNRPLIVRLLANLNLPEPGSRTEVLRRRCRCPNDLFLQDDGR